MDIASRNPNTPNSTLFKSFYKEVWRKMVPAGLSEAETEFIEDVAHLQAGNNVLDIMCGYGRHAIPLARKGYSVTAIDNLQDYIDEINEISLNENLPLKTKIADVTQANISGNFDCVLSMGNYFSTFDYPTAAIVLKNIADCMKPGGVFILNSWMIAEIAIKHFEAKTWLYVEEYKYLLDNKYLLHPSRIETDHIVINQQGETQTLKGIDYIISFAELDVLLNNAGFVIDAIYSTPRKRKYSFGDSRAYIVAVKQ